MPQFWLPPGMAGVRASSRRLTLPGRGFPVGLVASDFRDFPGRLFSASFLTRLLSLAIKCQHSQGLFLLILLVRTLSLGNLTYDPDSSQSSMEDSFRGLVSHQMPLMSSGSILSLTVLLCG